MGGWVGETYQLVHPICHVHQGWVLLNEGEAGQGLEGWVGGSSGGGGGRGEEEGGVEGFGGGGGGEEASVTDGPVVCYFFWGGGGGGWVGGWVEEVFCHSFWVVSW